MKQNMASVTLQQGFTLIELIVFIVVTGIIIASLVASLSAVLTQAPTANHEYTALELAQAQMELIVGQRRLIGFNFTDSCAGGCTPQAGYTVTSNIAATTIGTDSSYKIITVTTSGTGDAVIKTLVGDY